MFFCNWSREMQNNFIFYAKSIRQKSRDPICLQRIGDFKNKFYFKKMQEHILLHKSSIQNPVQTPLVKIIKLVCNQKMLCIKKRVPNVTKISRVIPKLS